VEVVTRTHGSKQIDELVKEPPVSNDFFQDPLAGPLRIFKLVGTGGFFFFDFFIKPGTNEGFLGLLKTFRNTDPAGIKKINN
jgi:hypothetical protein